MMISPFTTNLLRSARPLCALFIVVSFPSCDDDDGAGLPQPAVLSGPQVSVGDGQAWTEITYDPDGEPSEMAVVFTEAAMENLPTGSPHAHEFLLPMPSSATVAPNTHATLDWNEHGHAPPGVYDVPHFDIHFYFISQAERGLIGPNDTTEFNRPLPADQLPEMYIETPGGVPRMGAHVVNAMSPEVNGSGPFTHTFIYGKYDGQLNFLEPMAAESWLRTYPNITVPIRQPQSFGRSGYFPREYSITFDDNMNTFRVALRDFVDQ